MKEVICFGEALIDFLHTGSRPDGALCLNEFTQYPGGAPANAAVAVAKLGGHSVFAGQVGDDPFGRFLIESLEVYGVSTRLTRVHPSAKTALAFVFLDEQGERSFSFHRDNTADVLFAKSQVGDDWFADGPILHFCSNTLTEVDIANVTRHVVSLAQCNTAMDKKALISFDVNLRHNLWLRDEVDMKSVNDLVYQSHLVKFTREELDYLCGGHREAYLSRCFNKGVKTMLITDAGNTVLVHGENSCLEIDPPDVQAVDTTGGGDAFIGAVLYGLSQQADPVAFLNEPSDLKPLIEFAASCGAFTVTRKGAFPALPVFDDVQHEWKF